MKMTLKKIIKSWNKINQIYEVVEHFPKGWEEKMRFNFAIFSPFINEIAKLSPEVRKDLEDVEFDLAVAPLLMKDIPDSVPVGTLAALEPLIEDYSYEEPTINAKQIIDDIIKSGKTASTKEVGDSSESGKDGASVSKEQSGRGKGSSKNGDQAKRTKDEPGGESPKQD